MDQLPISGFSPQKIKLQQHREFRLRAQALARAGEMERARLISATNMPAHTAAYFRAMSLEEFVRRAKAANLADRHPLVQEFIKNCAALPWGYRPTTLTAVGAVSLHAEPIVEYQDTPLLSRPVGRRAKLAREISELSKIDKSYVVLTSPTWFLFPATWWRHLKST
jgi:hypothetical protein